MDKRASDYEAIVAAAKIAYRLYLACGGIGRPAAEKMYRVHKLLLNRASELSADILGADHA